MKEKMSDGPKCNGRCGLLAMTWHILVMGAKQKPFLLPVFLFLFVAIGITTTVSTFIKQVFFESVEGIIVGEGSLSKVVTYGIITSLFPVFLKLMQSGNYIIIVNFFEAAKGRMGKLLIAKAARIDPLVYEDNRFLDQVNKAHKGVEAVNDVANCILFMVLSQGVYLTTMGIYLFSIKPALIVMFAISFVPSIIGVIVRKRMYSKLEHLAAPYRRRYEYFGKCICNREYVKETRLWGASVFFNNKYKQNLEGYASLEWKTTKYVNLVELALRFLMLTGHIGTIMLLFHYMAKGEINVGAFAAIFSSLDNLFGQVDDLVSMQINTISTKFGVAQNYFVFLKLPERQGWSEKLVAREKIEFKDVSFFYPNSEKPALRNINLTLQKGETIAIVGVNGSGKSTLTRLLTGLYLPTKGEVLLDGRHVEEIAPAILYNGVSAVFQRYQSYKMTVAENVRISELDKKGVPDKSREVECALDKADFLSESKNLSEGLDTMLGKDFGGIDLSGGQWQRLAIARGLYRDHGMIVLDEPTAAIDPLEEAEIYRQFAEISKGKTALIVTHRLGSARIADKIIVMNEGNIVDIGTHEQLMQHGGIYSEMQQAQAKWYV